METGIGDHSVFILRLLGRRCQYQQIGLGLVSVPDTSRLDQDEG